MDYSHSDINADQDFVEIYSKCKDATMTSVERAFALYKGVRYVIDNKIEGDFVECGVWKGGSSMIIALTLKKFGDTSRKLYLYDTFDGMSEPTEEDKDFNNNPAKDLLETEDKQTSVVWSYSPEDEVRKNMESTGYNLDNIVFVKGKVEDTIPGVISSRIALLRLDTDWYASTLHELVHLYPLLETNGVLIIDDFGHWSGCRQAVEEYFKENNVKNFLHRIDYTGRMLIK